MAQTPRLGFEELSEGEAGQDVKYNSSFRSADALLQATATNYTATPPVSPSDGDLYIVGPSATGDWSGEDENVAYYSSSAWVFHTPTTGWRLWDQTANDGSGGLRVYNGTNWGVAVQKPTATLVGCVLNSSSDAASNYTLLNAFVNGGTGRVVEVDGIVHLSQKLQITAAYSGYVGKNYNKRVSGTGFHCDFADTAIEIAVGAGTNGAVFRNLFIDGNGNATTGLDFGNNNFHDSIVEDVYIKNIDGVGLNIGTDCYSSKFTRVFTSAVTTGLSIASENNQAISFIDCQFSGTSNGGIIGSNSVPSPSMKANQFFGCDFTSSGQPLTVLDVEQSVSFFSCWFEKSPGASLSDHLIKLGGSTGVAVGVNFYDCYYRSNNKCRYTFGWVNASSISIFGNCADITPTVGYIDVSVANLTQATSVLIGTPPPDPVTAINNSEYIHDYFKLWEGDTTASKPQHKTLINIDVDPGAVGTRNADTDTVLSIQKRADSYPSLKLTENSLWLGGGSSDVDCRLTRVTGNVFQLGTGDSLRIPAADASVLTLVSPDGSLHHLFVDDTGDFKILSTTSLPTDKNSDGTVVGTQS